MSMSSMSMSRISYLLGGEDLCYPSDEYLDYVTPADLFNIVLVNAGIHFNGLSNKVVWDMFAGIGTDSLRLAKHAGIVIATEIDPDTFTCLSKNVSGVSNITIYNRDCCDLKAFPGAQRLPPDVIYFDPPWGVTFKTGQTFSFDDIRLANGSAIPDVFLKLRESYLDSSFIIKLPFMCDFEKHIPEADIKCILTFSRQKLKYIFI